MKIEYRPIGVCCEKIYVEIENNKIISAQFLGGCNGNLKGIGQLIKGMELEDVISKLKGIECNGKPTSCPDQLSICLIKYLEEVKKPQKV